MAFSISTKIQDGQQNSGNSTFFTGTISKVSGTQRVQTLLEITLSLRVYPVAQKTLAAKSGGKVNFVKSHQYTLDTLGVENFDKIVLSHTVKEIEENLCFSICVQYLKIQNGRQFKGEEKLLKIGKSRLLRYCMG